MSVIGAKAMGIVATYIKLLAAEIIGRFPTNLELELHACCLLIILEEATHFLPNKQLSIL